MALFDKLDLFGVKREMLRKRIDEIFDARKRAIDEAYANYDMVASQVLKRHRVALETIRGKLAAGLSDDNFDAVNDALDGACELFGITLPYSTPREFLMYLRENENIVIR